MTELYYYEAGFDLALAPDNDFDLKISASGENEVEIFFNDILAQISNNKSKLFHYLQIYQYVEPADPNGPIGYTAWADSDFKSALQAAIISAVSGWTGAKDFTVTLSTSGYYTIARTGAFMLDPITDNTKYLLGLYNNGSMSGYASYTGLDRPYYLIVPTLPCLSNVKYKYEPENIASQAIPDSLVEPYGMTRTCSPVYYDWIQQFETMAKAELSNAATPNLWTFEHLIRHCRTVYPFILYSNAAVWSIHYLREDGARKNFEPCHPDLHTMWHIPFKTVYLGDATIP